MPTTATRFAGPVASATSDTTLFTVATGKRALVRGVRVCNQDAALTTKFLYGIGSTSSPNRIGALLNIPALGMAVDSTWFVINEGESFVGRRQTGDGLANVSVHGYLLTLI